MNLNITVQALHCKVHSVLIIFLKDGNIFLCGGGSSGLCYEI